MRKIFLILMMGALFMFPTFALAQTDAKLASVSVQLWPEYDQPSMLVITDFELPVTTKFPAEVTFRIPNDANLIAVAAYTADGNLMNAVFEGPNPDGDWQAFTVTLDGAAARFEYYQPISFNGEQRLFSYLWDGAYAVDQFDIRVLEPADTTSLTADPKLDSIEQKDGLKYFLGESVKLAGGEQYILNLEYTKTSDALISTGQSVQPAAPVDENTTGRVSFNNYLPYVIGGLGVVMIVGGVVYYWQSGKKSGGKKSRRRQHSPSENEEADSEIYCAQCGTRARGGDRFCRVCGSRIRQQEE
ncbi:MAG: hypothetical protein KA480_18050 [Anaerolineales bacterium]|nr:hypothetical protein [Anaerolineales bacterium]